MNQKLLLFIMWRARGDLNPGLLHLRVLQLFPVFLRGFGKGAPAACAGSAALSNLSYGPNP